jgi:16S rRNA (guanine966-N2)-methyltransferase
MRVIAGAARGRKLQAVPGAGTRPITDRAKEALFAVLGDEIVGAVFLDLFAGTGSVGIEALSRGAGRGTFVEASAAAVQTIRANLTRTGLGASAQVVRGDVFAHLAGPPEPSDLIYVAPPQYEGTWRAAVEALDRQIEWLAPGGVLVVQIHPKEYEALATSSLREERQRRYGGVLLVFYRRPVSTVSG